MNRALIEGLLKIGLATAAGLVPGAGAILTIAGAVTEKVVKQIEDHNSGRALDDLTQEEMEASVSELLKTGWKSPEDLEGGGL